MLSNANRGEGSVMKATAEIEELDTVVLLCNAKEHGLERGDIGAGGKEHVDSGFGATYTRRLIFAGCFISSIVS